jgi:hypothetical protein
VEYDTAMDAGATAGRIIAEKLENGIDNLDDALCLINDTLHRMAHALEALAEAQRQPVRYEYRMVVRPTAGELSDYGATGFRLRSVSVVNDPDGAAEYAYLERPIYAEGEEG